MFYLAPFFFHSVFWWGDESVLFDWNAVTYVRERPIKCNLIQWKKVRLREHYIDRQIREPGDPGKWKWSFFNWKRTRRDTVKCFYSRLLLPPNWIYLSARGIHYSNLSDNRKRVQVFKKSWKLQVCIVLLWRHQWASQTRPFVQEAIWSTSHSKSGFLHLGIPRPNPLEFGHPPILVWATVFLKCHTIDR